METAEHVLRCPEVGRVAALHGTIDLMQHWLEEVGTDPDLIHCLCEFAHRRDGMTMEEVCRSLPGRFRRLAVSQDKIGW